MQLDSDQTAKPDSVLWLRAFMRLPIIIDEAHKVLDLDEKILAGIMKAQRAWCTLFSVPCRTPPEISTVRQDDIVLFLGFNDSERNIFFFSASKKIQRWNFTSSWTRSFAFVFLFLPPPSNVSKAFEILNVMNSMSKKQLHNQRQARDEQCVELIARPFLQ